MPISYVTAASLDGTQNGSAPIYGARAWVNFNGTGTVAIRASGNVSSITDNGTGDYTVNFTTAMLDANYAVSITFGDAGATVTLRILNAATTGSQRFTIASTSAVPVDTTYVNVAIFR